MDRSLIAEVARRHGLSEAAVGALWEALARGGGRQAQFDHRELGGFGQWSGGMVQIGDMFNATLKAKVAAAGADLADALARGVDLAPRPPSDVVATPSWERSDGAWWPAELGRPSAVGTQNASRYAVFPEARRLAVVERGRVTVYDTGNLRITGVSQQQSTCSAVAFTSQNGTVMLDALRVIGSREIGA